MSAVQPLPEPTGAEVPACTREEAEELTATIRHHGGVVWDAMIRAYQGRAWVALDYGTWAEYCRAEFGTDRLSLPRPKRQQVVEEMRDAGLSTRAIGAAIGTSDGTVRNDLKAGAQPYAPADEPQETGAGNDGSPGEGDVSDAARAVDAGDGAHGHDVGRPEPEPAPTTPPRIMGTDGKSYSPRQGDAETIAGEILARDKPELVERETYRSSAKVIRSAWNGLKDIDPAVAGRGCRTHAGGDLFLEKVEAVEAWLKDFRRAERGFTVVKGER